MSFRFLTRAVLVLLAVSSSACSRKSEEPSPAAAGTASSAKPGTTAPVASARPTATGPIEPVFSIPDKLRVEASHRSDAGVPSEKVFAAFEAAGLAITERAQHVGAVFGASYCVGATVDGDVKISVCEFATPAEATDSRDKSAKLLASIPNREVFAHKAGTLTVRQPAPKTPKSEATAKKLKATYDAL
ncbi:MAG: hypothetical protein U0169_17920 [Polyangiaceae bacterium]